MRLKVVNQNNDRNGGKWQLAFWIITVITTVFFVAFSANVIANDRLRAMEDRRIEERINSIDTRLARIEGHLGIKVLNINE